MNPQPDQRNTWQHRIALAALTGLISGATRALITWTLHH